MILVLLFTLIVSQTSPISKLESPLFQLPRELFESLFQLLAIKEKLFMRETCVYLNYTLRALSPGHFLSLNHSYSRKNNRTSMMTYPMITIGIQLKRY